MTEKQKADAVRTVQQWLYELRAVYDLGYVYVDGVYDASTAEAVASFQRQCGLPVTGAVDLATWRRLSEEAKNHRPVVPAGFSPFDALPCGGSLRPGDRMSAVYPVQAVLREVALLIDLEPCPEMTGLYDAPTEAAVRFLQRSMSLEETGELDPASWNALVSLYRTLLREAM